GIGDETRLDRAALDEPGQHIERVRRLLVRLPVEVLDHVQAGRLDVGKEGRQRDLLVRRGVRSVIYDDSETRFSVELDKTAEIVAGPLVTADRHRPRAGHEPEVVDAV